MNSLDNTEKHGESLVNLRVQRPIYEYEALNRRYRYEKPKKSSFDNVRKNLDRRKLRSCASSLFPFVGWTRKYKWKESFVADVISGLTVAVMHIPQGMAYALLGNMPPVVGIYMAFFPVLVYFFFGTSKHVSMGTFAIVCLMTGKAVTALSTPNISSVFNETKNGTNTDEFLLHVNETQFTPMQVATAVTFMVGIIQILMYIFRLGIMSALMSEPLVNGFTTGAAVHVLMSQIKDILGLKLPKQKRDYFKLVFTTVDIFKEIPNTNATAVVVSAIGIVVMYLNNEFAKPWLKKKCSMPIPIELIAVVAGTLISNYCNLPEIYGIQTVGDIPTGLPKPELPNFKILPLIVIDSISITMVSYTITLSMALIFAQKLHYEIDSNQELLAMGVSNIVGSFFSCMPVSASLSRSLIQQTVGGRTQVASLVSCAILLVILLWIGPFFEPLPRCVLASIIVVALKGMLLQARQLSRFWKLSKLDGFVWIVTFLSVVLVGIDVGLLVGLLTSLGSILLLTVEPYICILGHVPNTDLYLDVNHYAETTEYRGIKIFRYCGGLNFANCARFKVKFYDLVQVSPRKIMKKRAKSAKMAKHILTAELPINASDTLELRCVIIDMSALSYVDPSAIAVLHSIVEECALIDVSIFLAACSSPVYEKIVNYDVRSSDEHRFTIFATLHDAVSRSLDEIASN